MLSMAVKKKIAVISVLCMIAATFMSGCASSYVENSQEKDDTVGIQKSNYECVVALSKSIADMWLLSGGTLKGVTEDAFELDGLNDGAESVGTISKPSTEAILSLKPDLVLLSGELAAHEQLKAELDKLSVYTIAITVDSFEDYDNVIYMFSEMNGRDDLYQKNVTEVKKRIDSIVSEVGDKFEGTSYLCIKASATKTKALKKDHFACNIMDDLCLYNIADDDSALNDLSIEEIALQDPDYIFVVFMGDDDKAAQSFADEFESQAVFKELRAVKEDKLIILPKDLFNYKPNARWDEAYKYVKDILEKE